MICLNLLHGKDILNIEKSIPIPIDKLFPFPNHPFQVNNDEKMEEMAKTIKESGVSTPLIVRPRADGNYEIISGHRRKFASELAKLKEVPCIIRNLTEDEAIIEMVNSNMQREKILPSEKAFAYKMKLEAQKHQGKRNDITLCQVGTKLRTDEKIAENSEDSARQIQRYIRLTELIPELLKLVDEERIAFSPAVDISYLTEDEQYVILNIYDYDEKTPNVSQAKHLKMLSQEGKLTADKIEEIMGEQKPNQIEKFKFNKDRIRKILPKNITTEKQAEDFVVKCIEEHNQREERKKQITR